MKASSKVFFWFLLILVVSVSGYKFKQFFLDQDYTLLVNLDCSPAIESCFVMDCSPEEDSECDDTPYKKLEMWAGSAPQCLLERECLDFSCPEGDESCSVTYCDNETRELGEKCEIVITQEGPEIELDEEILNE